MVKKFDVITKLYEEATQEVTESPEKWIAFLQSASKNYRLPFDEQLLIHVQRPEATAVLPMEKWNEKFGRWVKRDSKGIAVFDKSSNHLKLKYYFDVSDTREGKYKRLVRPVSLWSVSEEQREPVKEALSNAFGVTDGDRKEFAMVILESSLNIAEDNIGDYLPDILLATKDSPLEEMDEFNIRLKMKQLLANSISYMLFVRCGIEPDIYLETRDFWTIREFHTKELVNLFGVAASDMSEMALGEVADTIRKLQIQERKQRTFVERKTADYNVNNKQETTTERRQDNGSNHIQQTGRLSPAESYNSRGRGSSPWEVRISPKSISDEESVRNVSEPSDSRNLESASASDGGRSTDENGNTYPADGRERGSDGGIESQRSDGVDRANEQYPAESTGNREERNSGELKWHDRSSEDHEIAFLSNDEIIKSLLLFAPHLKATNAEISDFYESHEERKAQMEYVKSLFPTGVTEYTLENGDAVGFDKYENVLHIWRGTYENRIEQGYYDWYVIAGYYDGIRVLGELKDSRETLLSVDGQLQLIDDRAVEDVSTFSFTQEIIDRALQSGSSFSQGKYRIYCYFKQGHSMEDGSFSVYNDVRDKLIAKGVPPEEIAFIHDANTEVRKKELFSKVRRGAVRILMGSTFKMGAGTNVQDLIIASHDLDCPWRPRDLEQRAGRTVRQGNKNPKVDVVRYVTEGTFDAYLYQIIENKQKFISQIMTSKSPARSVEDIDEVALSYAEIKALAVGNPYIKEKMDLDIQVSKLQLLKQSFLSQKYEMEDKAVRYFPNEIRQCEQRIADYESDIALAKENTPPDRETFPEMQIHDVVYTEKKEAGQAIIEACKAMKSADAVLIGRYRGFPMKLSYDSFQKVFVISMYGKQVYHVPLGTDIHGNITRLDNKIQEIPDKMLRCQDKLENLKVQLENAKEETQKEFPQKAELAEKVARLGELNVLLDMDKKDQVLLDDGEGVEIEPEQKKKERER